MSRHASTEIFRAIKVKRGRSCVRGQKKRGKDSRRSAHFFISPAPKNLGEARSATGSELQCHNVHVQILRKGRDEGREIADRGRSFFSHRATTFSSRVKEG